MNVFCIVAKLAIATIMCELFFMKYVHVAKSRDIFCYIRILKYCCIITT